MGDSVEQFPSPFLQFDNFLDVEDVGRLMAFIENNEMELSASSVLAAPGDEDADIRSSQILFDLEEIWPMFEGQLEGLLPTIRRELEVPWFTLSHVERQLTVSYDGDFFGLHNDSGGPEVATREVTYVYYFNTEPKQYDGGELWVYDYFDEDYIRYPGQNHVVVEPRHNSIVFFPSWVNHEVRPVNSTTAGLAGSRMTVNGWFHAT